MNTAIRLMKSKSYDSLVHLAHQTGYYDQADFIKHVKQYLGDKPPKIIKLEQDLLFKYMGGPKR